MVSATQEQIFSQEFKYLFDFFKEHYLGAGVMKSEATTWDCSIPHQKAWFELQLHYAFKSRSCLCTWKLEHIGPRPGLPAILVEPSSFWV